MKQEQGGIEGRPGNNGTFGERPVTTGDLVNFKRELLFEMGQLLKEATGRPAKQWLKTHEVRRLLGISPGTLQTLRNNGTLPSAKLGGVVYYSTGDILKVMDRLKSPKP